MSTCPLATREAVKAALDIAKTSRANWQIDGALTAGTEAIEGELHRTIRPYYATHTFDWPKPFTPTRTWQLWLDNRELISVTSMTAGGVTLTPSQYLPDPPSGPPFTGIQANVNTLGSFPLGSTWQRNISITGLYGYQNDETAAPGPLTAGVSASDTSILISNGAKVGVGDLLRIDSEYLITTERDWVVASATLTGALTESQAGRAVTVTDGTAFHRGELIAVDTETMWVTDITGNTLTVRRAWDGSLLAAHSNGAAVYASRSLTVTRAARGSTAATHSNGTTIWRHVPPGLIERATIGHALLIMGAEQSGYQQTAGAGETTTQWTATGIGYIRTAARAAHGRVARFRT